MAATAHKVVETHAPLHRVGTPITGALKKPVTVGDRLTALRLNIGLTQEQVANAVSFTFKSGESSGKKQTLSRNAYCMYESDHVEPDYQKTIALAKVLKTSPQYIAFGIKASDFNVPKNFVGAKVYEYIFDTKKNTFARQGSTSFSNDWLTKNFNSEANDLAMIAVEDYTASFGAGDTAVVRRSVMPTASGADFVFTYNAKSQRGMRVAHLVRSAKSDDVRIFDAERKSHITVPFKSLTVFGKVVGRIGKLEHN